MPHAITDARRRTDGYHHWLEAETASPDAALAAGRQDYEQLAEILRRPLKTGSRSALLTTGGLALQQIEEHLKETGADPADLGQLHSKSTIFAGYMRLMQAIALLVEGTMASSGQLTQLRISDTATAIQIWHSVMVRRHGERVFHISKGLSPRLYLTSIEGLKWKELQLPFPSVVLWLPPGLISIQAVRTGWHRLDTIIVSEGHDEQRRVISFFFMGQENEKSIAAGDDATFFINLKQGENSDEALLEDAIPSAFAFELHPDAPIGMRDETGRFTSGEESIRRAIQYAINVLLYIGSTGDCARAPFPARWGKLKEKSRRLAGRKLARVKAELKEIEGQHRPYLVGTSIPIDPNLTRAASEASQAKRGSPQVASYVRGHWKRQPYGPEAELRKLIWLQPYWRNLEGETHAPSYEVR